MKLKVIAAGGLALALTLGGSAIMASAEEIAPPTDTTTQEATPSTDTTAAASPTTEEAAPVVSDPAPSDQPTEPTTEQAPVVEQTAAVVDTGEQITLHWLTPNTGDTAPTADTVGWPQTPVDPAACGTGWIQNDVNRYGTPADKALVDSYDDDGYLVKVNGTPEDSATVVSWTFTQQTPCVVVPPVITPTECSSTSTLPLATSENPQGWGDLKGGTWTADGIQLTATASDEAYAYIDLPAAFKLSEVGSLATDATNLTGSYGVILQTTGPNFWSVHYDADGTFWTVHPGILPETTPGYYSGTLSDLLSDPEIYEVAVWVNPGGSLLLHSQAFHCAVQPFGAEAVVVTPPTDEPPVVTLPVVVPVTPVANVTPANVVPLAFTGEQQSASDGRNMAMAYALLGLALGLLLLSIERLAHYSRKV